MNIDDEFTRSSFDDWSEEYRDQRPDLTDDEYSELMHEAWLALEINLTYDDLIEDYTEHSVLAFRFGLWHQRANYKEILCAVDKWEDARQLAGALP